MPSTYLKDADTGLAQAFTAGKIAYEAEYPARALIVTCTYRSTAEQWELYHVGRVERGTSWVIDDNPTTSIVTQLDGRTKKSNHNVQPSRAIDFAVTIGGKVSWDDREYMLVLPFMRDQGLICGGDWTKFKDYPHVELPKS